jgi:hypothetical protein
MPEGKEPGFDGVQPPEKTDHEKEKIERLRRAMYSRELSPKIHDRDRRALGEQAPLVGEDWKREESRIENMQVAPRTIGTARSAMRGIIFASVAFFLGAVAFFGYYFFFGEGATPASPGNIDISVTGPLQIQSGEPTELQVAVVNRNRVALELADLVISYPKGTRSPTDLSTDLPSQRISLGNIEPGGRRQGTVSAIFAGKEGDRAAVKVELEYRLQNSSSIFAADTSYSVIFSSSPISLAVDGNTETISGQPVEFNVTVASNADAAVKDVLLAATYPFGFRLESADPKPAQGNVWELGELRPGQKKSVKIRGTASGESGDERVFRFTAGTRKAPEEKTITATLADFAHHLTISNPFLGLAINFKQDSGQGGAVVAPGETVSASVAYQNHLSTPLSDVVIVAQLSGVEIDGATVKSNDGFYRSADRVMYWDKSTEPSLANIAPGARGTLNFSFQMPNNEALAEIRDPKVTITAQAAAKRVGQPDVPETLQATAKGVVRVASDLQLVAQGLYYSNPFGSSGPMPPKANSETTYAIVFSLINTTNEIESAIVKATLPPYVRWTGTYSPSGANITFNQNDGTVTWEAGTIAPNTGVGGSVPKQAAIVIGFTPSTSQIGSQPPLVRNISLTGKDTATGAAVTRTVQDVTTNISGDTGFLPSNATVVK